MADISKDIERILNSDRTERDDIADVVNRLRQDGRYDIIDQFTSALLNTRNDNVALLFRAWYLINMEERYKEGLDILRTIGESDDVMFALLYANALLKVSADCDAADGILNSFVNKNADLTSETALEAARMFARAGYADMAEQWICRYEGSRDIEYLLICGDIMTLKEDYDAAAEIYRNITTLYSECTEAWLHLADIMLHTKQYADAYEAARHVTNCEHNNQKAEEIMNVCRLCINRQNNKL